jgi:hypothetical protein
MYNDHVLSPWRAEHLESKQPVPAFDVEHLLAIAQRGGYDWMLKEEVELLSALDGSRCTVG